MQTTIQKFCNRILKAHEKQKENVKYLYIKEKKKNSNKLNKPSLFNTQP